MRRRALLLALGAALLRGIVAVVTETKPVFPSYYYTDAELIHGYAARVAQAWSLGEKAALPGAPSQRVHAVMLGAVYSVTGPRPLAGKLLSAAAGGLGVWLLFEAALPVFGAGPALAAAAALALWPSHAFYTSQNFKDPYVLVFLLAGWAALARLLERGPSWAWSLVAAVSLVGLGFWRQPLLYPLCAAAAAAALWKRSWAALAVAVLTAALFRPLLASVLYGPLAAQGRREVQHTHLQLLPPADPDRDAQLKPYDPKSLALIRRLRLENDRNWAQAQRGRRVATQLFPDLDFDSWFDVLVFLPKGMFYVLFMPLPFLYPMEGNLGRLLASAENAILLLLAGAAVAAAVRQPGSPARAAMLLFVLIMAAGSAVVEFDLGSVSRHRLQYVCLLLPFAFSWRRKA